MRGSIIHSSPAGGKKKALLIAVKDIGIPGFPKLRNSHRHAQELEQLLIEVFGYVKENIVLMMDIESPSKDLWPTKARIRKQIHLFVRDISPGDHLFFYYSGHGRQTVCNHHSESDGLDEEICACGGGRIMDNDLKKWLIDPLPCGSKLFALWDSCHSDTILDLDHHKCNEPAGNGEHRCVRRRGSPTPAAKVWKALLKKIQVFSRKDLTNSPAVQRGRPLSRRLTLTAVSEGSSPVLSRWIPFSVGSTFQRVLSPESWFPCDGKCKLPTEATDRAHVVSLSACKDSELAYDDEANNGSVTKFFVDHLREKPKSTLLELLEAVRARVNMISEARRLALDVQTKVISRRTTFAGGSALQWPTVQRRETEIDVRTLDEFLRARLQAANEEVSDEALKARYSQKPGYSSHYRLNLDELVDL